MCRNTCLAEDKLRPKTLVGRDDSSEQGLHANLVSLSHHNNDPASLRLIRMTGLQQVAPAYDHDMSQGTNRAGYLQWKGLPWEYVTNFSTG